MRETWVHVILIVVFSVAMAATIAWSSDEPPPTDKKCRDYPMVLEEQQTDNLICGVIRCGDRIKGISCVLIPLDELGE